MTYNLLCISVVNPVTYDAPSSVWHAGFDLWLMIRHIQLPRKKCTDLVSTLSGSYNWNNLMPNEAKKNLHWCFEKMPYVKDLLTSSRLLLIVQIILFEIDCAICYTNLKFIYSEKATKFCGIFTLLLTVCTVVKSGVKISQHFVAFSEYMIFTCIVWSVHKLK